MAGFKIAVPGSPLERSLAFIEAWRRASNDADIDVRLGKSEDGKSTAICVSIDGQHHAFTAAEARKVIRIAEDTIRKYPEESRGEGLHNMVRALKTGVQHAQPN